MSFFTAANIAIVFITACLILMKRFKKRLVLVNRNALPSEKEKSAPLAISICFASQTGTAAEFAKELILFFKQPEIEMHFDSSLIDLKDFTAASKKADLFIFVAATYGEGEAPDNSSAFYADLIATEKFLEHFSKAKIAVFGLGDSSYTYFNEVSKCISKRCLEMGSAEYIPLAFGDDAGNLTAEFANWKQMLFLKLLTDYTSMEKTIAASFVSKQDASIDKYGIQIIPRLKEAKQASTLRFKVAKIENLSPNCIYHQFEIVGEVKGSLKLAAGDHIGVYAQNSYYHVEKLVKKLSINENYLFELLEKASSKIIFSGSFKEFFSRFVDLHCPVTVDALKHLAVVTKESFKDKKFIESLLENYDRLILNEYFGIVDTLCLLSSTITISDIIGCFQLLQPRYYSISATARDPKTNMTSISVIFKEIILTTPLGEIKCGLASEYFLTCPEEMHIKTRKSNFNLFKHTDRPLILIGAGTGISPYIGFLEERKLALVQGKKKQKTDEVHLFFGCKCEEDFIFQNFFESHIQEGILKNFHVAFSRSQHTPKCYVQDMLLKHASIMHELVTQKHAIIYVCGNAHGMAKGVRAAWIDIFGFAENLSKLEAASKIDLLISQGRYKQDVY